VNKQRLNLIFAILSLSVCCSIPVTALVGSQGSFAQVSDFPEYYSSARMMVTGQGADVYKLPELFGAQISDFPELGMRGIGFYIPPFAAPLLAPLGFLPPAQSYAVYIAAAIAALVAGCVALAKYFKLDAQGTVWLLTIICAGGPAFEALKIAQLAPFLFALLSFFLVFARKNEIAAAACLAGLLLKPQELLPLAVFLLFSRRFKIIAALAVIGIALVVISYFLLGAAGYANYVELLKNSAANTQYMKPELCATLRGQLLRLTELGTSAANTISSAALLAVIGFIAFFANRFSSGREQDGATPSSEQGLLQLALPLGLVSALHCHDYDLLLLAPWVLSLYKQENKNTADKLSLLFACLLVILLIVPFYIPIHYTWLMRDGQPLNPFFFILAAAAALSAAGYITRARTTPQTGASTD
jgi:hypothetical protein